MPHAMSTLIIHAAKIIIIVLSFSGEAVGQFREQNHEFNQQRVSRIQPTRVFPQRASESQVATAECVLTSCCGRLNNCQPEDCHIDTRTCTAAGAQRFLTTFGHNTFGDIAFFRPDFDVGNLRVIFGDTPDKRAFDSVKGVAIASKYGTIAVLQNSVTVSTLLVSNAPHINVGAILETRGSQKISHRVVMPENADIVDRLQCGPIIVLEQLTAPSRTVWTVITPITTTVIESTCTKFVGRTNLYENVPNFYTAPPSSGGGEGFVNRNNWGDRVRQPWQHVPQQRPNYKQPFFNGHANSHRSSPPCYWCPARYNSWQVPHVGFTPPSPVSLGWYGRPSTTKYSSGFSGTRWFSDVVADQVKDEKTACAALVEQYVDSPLTSEQNLVDFVNKTFYGTDESRKKFANGVKPTTLHCCYTEFGTTLFQFTNATIANDNKIEYSTPILSQNVTCTSLVDELYKQFRGNSSTPEDKANKST